MRFYATLGEHTANLFINTTQKETNLRKKNTEINIANRKNSWIFCWPDP